MEEEERIAKRKMLMCTYNVLLNGIKKQAEKWGEGQI